MRRALLPLALLLLWPAAADAATVRLTACAPALDSVARRATFEARMAALPGTDRMRVRFTLQARGDGAGTRWRRVVAPGFDQWLSSTRVRRYSYARTIQNLAVSVSYRTIVRFRWLDAAGQALRSGRATSPACHSADLRPDLEPVSVEALDGPDVTERRYRVTIRNSGRSAAGAFELALGDGVAALAALAAGAEQVVTLTVPACVETIALTVDARDAVDERDETDNQLTALCQP